MVVVVIWQDALHQELSAETTAVKATSKDIGKLTVWPPPPTFSPHCLLGTYSNPTDKSWRSIGINTNLRVAIGTCIIVISTTSLATTKTTKCLCKWYWKRINTICTIRSPLLKAYREPIQFICICSTCWCHLFEPIKCYSHWPNFSFVCGLSSIANKRKINTNHIVGIRDIKTNICISTIHISPLLLYLANHKTVRRIIIPRIGILSRNVFIPCPIANVTRCRMIVADTSLCCYKCF